MSSSTSNWPKEASARALFYYTPPSTDGTIPSTNDDDDDSMTCRLVYNEPTHTIRIISNHNSKGEEEVVLDWFDPKDVIGAKLEFQLNVAEEKEKEESLLKERLNKTALHDDDDNEDNKKSKEEKEEEQEDIVTCGTALSNVLSSETTDLLFGDCNNNAAASTIENWNNSGYSTATLNVYCYPRYRPEEMGYSLMGGAKRYEGVKLPLPTEKEIKEEDMGEWGERRAVHRTLEVAPCGDFADVLSVVRAIRNVAKLNHYGSGGDDDDTLSMMQQRRKKRQALLTNNQGETNNNDDKKTSLNGPAKYLVVINPFAGVGLAESIYESTTKKMFEECGIEHDVLRTERAGHALDRMKFIKKKTASDDDKMSNEEKEKQQLQQEEEKDILEYDGIVAMGGDGILAEVIQGIKSREDAKNVLENIPLGYIGCGTSNGFARSILFESKEKCNPITSTFYICKGQTKPFDLSEHSIHITTSDDNNNSNDATTTTTKSYYGFLHFCWALIADCDLESEVLRFLGSLRSDIWAVWRIICLRTYRARFSYLPKKKTATTSQGGGEEEKEDEIVLPSLTDDVPSNWKTIEDDFILVWCNQGSHCEEGMHSSPYSSVQDGVFQVLIVRATCSRFKLFKMFLGIEHGGHVDSDACETFECVAYRLEPLTKGSYNDLDGEKIEDGPIQARVLPGAAHTFY